jgi:thioredoxin-related protein
VLKFFTVAIVLILVPLSGADLHWERDLQSAFDKAAKNNQTLMVMVVKDGCRWCAKMKEQTLKNDKIAARLQNYVLVRIDKNVVSSEHIPQVDFVPTIFFMTPQKEILESVTGYFNVGDFNSWIDDVEIKLRDMNGSKS